MSAIRFTETTKDNKYILIPENADVITHKMIVDKLKGHEKAENIFQVYLTREAVELFKESEALVINKYSKTKEQHRESAIKYAQHKKMVDELMEVRNFLNP